MTSLKLSEQNIKYLHWRRRKIGGDNSDLENFRLTGPPPRKTQLFSKATKLLEKPRWTLKDIKQHHYTRPGETVSPAGVTGASCPPHPGQKHPPPSLEGRSPGCSEEQSGFKSPGTTATRRRPALRATPARSPSWPLRNRPGSSGSFRPPVTVPRRASGPDHSNQ